MDIKQKFDQYQEYFLKSDGTDAVYNDLVAFNILQKYNTNKNRDIIDAAAHDIIYLNTDLDVMSENTTDDEIIILIRCGVMYDADTDSLSMFV